MKSDSVRLVTIVSGAMLVFALAAGTRRRAHQDYVTRGQLRKSTSASAYLTYGLHAALLAAAARWERRPLRIGSKVAWSTGIILASAGSALYFAALAALAGPEMSGTRMGGLTTDGAYRISRNPQLVGWALVLLGVAIARRSASALGLWCGYAVMLPGTIHDEERTLERAYESQYRMYRQRTPRYLGLGSRPHERTSPSSRHRYQ